MRAVSLPTPDDLAAARQVVAAHLAPTPLAGPLKLETLQPTGSFKIRGALAALARTPPHERVITASAGNHGLGVAWAAATLGRAATIVVPENASPAKLAALERIGADVVRHGDAYEEAEAHALALDGRFVSAYNDRDVIAGQATIGAELPAGPLLVVCAIGGGGLLAGLVLWARERGDARVVGVEAAASRAVSTAAAAGRVVEVEVRPTLADGLAGNLEPGSLTPQVARDADALVAVEEPAIEDAMRALAREHGVVAEGAGAAAYAAVREGLAGAPRRRAAGDRRQRPQRRPRRARARARRLIPSARPPTVCRTATVRTWRTRGEEPHARPAGEAGRAQGARPVPPDADDQRTPGAARRPRRQARAPAVLQQLPRARRPPARARGRGRRGDALGRRRRSVAPRLRAR